jgi:hypothetical protein
MSQNQTFQHIRPAFQNDNSNVRGKKDGLNDVSLEQEANRVPVQQANAPPVQMMKRGEKEPRRVDNDSNNGAATFKCFVSPTPGYFSNDVEGDLPANFPDFSPLPYEYLNASNNNNDHGQPMIPQQRRPAGNDAKRQKIFLEMANRFQQHSGITTLGLPIFPRRFNDVTCRKEPQRDGVPAHYDEQDSPHLQWEERKQQHEYLSTTLNFPYKDFIKKNQGDNIQLWHDEEEQSRLEKHFNTKWQVEFFSKFYSGELLETPDIFGPKTRGSENQAKKDDSSKNCSLSASTTRRSEEDDDVVFVSMTSTTSTFKNSFEDNRHVQEKGRKDHSNTQNEKCISPSASSSNISHHSILLQEAAMKLSAAMDDTDKTRDIITCLEKEMQVNRDVILKDERIAYGATATS